jgi:monovalent cation/proton antiporter MnhG/PhaG subunit
MRAVLIWVLLGAGVLIQLLCSVGVLVMNDAFDRLHFTGPTSLGGLLIALAAVVDVGLSVVGVKAILIALLLSLINPVLTHATGHAGRVRQLEHQTSLESGGIDP